MGWVCGTYGRQERFIQGFGGWDLKDGEHLEGLVIDGRIILKWILKKLDGGWSGMDSIDLPQDRDSFKCLTQKVKALRSFETSGSAHTASHPRRPESSLIFFLSVDDGGWVTIMTGVLNVSVSRPFGYLQNLRKSGQANMEKKFPHGCDLTELYIVACWCFGLLWSVLSGTFGASGLLRAYCSSNDM